MSNVEAGAVNPAETLAVILRTGALVGVDRRGQLVTRGLPPGLTRAVDDQRAELGLAVVGSWGVTMAPADWPEVERGRILMRLMTGHDPGPRSKVVYHRWRECSHCHRPALTPKAGATCRATPGCPGKLADPEPRPPLELDGRPVPCSRPGCSAAATWLTAWHEPVCTDDFHHLALLERNRDHP